MAYADYAFYTGTYKGNAIAVVDFDRLIARAGSWLDRMTNGESSSYSPATAVKLAACAVAEAWQVNEQGGEMVSQSVGSWSQSFTAQKRSNEERLLEAARMYLGNLIQPVRWC